MNQPLAVETEYQLKRKLVAVDIGELLSMEIPPREMLLAPILPRQGLVMAYSKRGLGKTHLALNIAYAVSSGGRFLRWEAPKPARVLLVDGEMPLVALQERLASIVAGAEEQPPDPSYFKIIAADHQEEGIPCLTTPEGVNEIERYLIDGVDLVVLDNLSTLCRTGRENEGESWAPVQEWALGLRRRGISVLFIHHAGKGGNQRGTSRREDVLDTVIALRHPIDYSSDQGARFEVHLEKARGAYGDDVKPFEAKMNTNDGATFWTTADLENVELNRVAELVADGYTVRDIGDELGISKSKAQRLKAKAEAEGL